VEPHTDTPLPPEEPGGQNRPMGPIINYYLGKPATGPVTLEIFDAQRQSRCAAMEARTSRPRSTRTADRPSYWIARRKSLSAQAARTASSGHALAGRQGKSADTDAAIYRDTPPRQGPMVPRP